MFAKNYHLHWIAATAYILSKCSIHIFFQFWTWLLPFFSMLSPASYNKKILKIFFYIVLLLVWLQTVCLRFFKSYFRLEPCKVNHNTKLHCHCLLLDQGAHIFFWKEKQSRSFVFFTKKGFSWVSCFSWDHM